MHRLFTKDKRSFFDIQGYYQKDKIIITVMSRSEPKPKIIYKNLEDLIKSNSINKNKGKNSFTQRTNPQTLKQSTKLHANTTQAIPKIKFIQKNTPQPVNGQVKSGVQTFSTYYNQIDAIFTEIEDLFCQSKQKVLDQVRSIMEESEFQKSGAISVKALEKVQQMKKMSEYIRCISNYFINGQVPQFNNNNELHYFNQPDSASKSTVIYNQTATQVSDSDKTLTLSMKNSKARVSRRADMINHRKKTIYELILEQKQNKSRVSTSNSKKKLKMHTQN